MTDDALETLVAAVGPSEEAGPAASWVLPGRPLDRGVCDTDPAPAVAALRPSHRGPPTGIGGMFGGISAKPAVSAPTGATGPHGRDLPIGRD
jgi:hypothetical protein